MDPTESEHEESDFDSSIDGDEDVEMKDSVSGVPSNTTNRDHFLKDKDADGKGGSTDGSKRKKRKRPKSDPNPVPPQPPIPPSTPDPIPPLTPNPIPSPNPDPIPPKTPVPNPDPNPPPLLNPHSQKPIPRPRQYQEGSQTEWVVFFRPKQKPLNFVQITKDLQKHYPGVVECTKLNKSKLRVIVNSAVQANQIVTDLRFSIEYRVWIPAHKVEIDGVVTDDSLSLVDLSRAVGRFKNPKLPAVEVLECRQLGNVTTEGGQKKFIPSASFRVTFAGSALPDYIELYKLRLPVRLYVPRVMSCENCQQLGHTKTYCSNKSKCSKCAGPHKDVDCQKQAEKCLLCGGEPHKTRQCPKYKEREDKMKRSLRERSKKSFAEILSQVTHPNRFAPLADEDSGDEDSDVEVLFQRDEESDSSGPNPKRNKASKSRKAAGGKGKESDSLNFEEDFPFGPSGKPAPKPAPKPTPKPAPIPLKPLKPVPKLPKIPLKTVPQPNPITDAFKGVLPFSTIVEWLCSFVSEPTRLIIKRFEPLARHIGKQLASTTPLLSFISFDG
ncbi:uncharacterized protein LOC128093590 [Culex pipiens pallens]|uniref:uncharacterized protein LOC128093590 n=1 Tax=Culex pipiens pallens TaxID=42434 RepID=UPI0022AAF0B4|nr:uncharacterized protein LOC128093590 [Culex pipiens pallens]